MDITQKQRRRQRIPVTRALLEDAVDAINAGIEALEFMGMDRKLRAHMNRVAERIEDAMKSGHRQAFAKICPRSADFP